MKGRLGCQWCDEITREHDLRASTDLDWLCGLYLAHLIESHFDLMEKARELRLQEPMTPETLTAWKRL